MQEIKQCPFCGGEAETYGECDMVRVVCTVCGANTSGWWDEPEEAIADWNRRAVVHAEWIDRCVRDWHCSKCGAGLRPLIVDGYLKNDLPNYCPNCGASMKGEA